MLVLLAYFEKVVGRTRLQKIVFLLQRKFNTNFGYNFVSYFYGPYSRDLQFDVNLLNMMDVVNVSAGTGVYIHTLSEKGMGMAKDIMKRRNEDPEIKELISRLDYFKAKKTSSLVMDAKKLSKHPSLFE